MKKEKMGKTEEQLTIEELQKKLTQKRKEIESLQKSVAEKQNHFQEKRKPAENEGTDKMDDGLLNVGFGMLGVSDSTNAEKPTGLFGLINELSKLAEKSQMDQTTQKTINFGKGGVVDFRLSSRPLKANPASQPSSAIKIKKPNKQNSNVHETFRSIAGTIKEREPMVDVFEEEDCIHVVIELSNVKENEIKLIVEENILTINAGCASTKEYCKKVELPTPVEKEIIESSYRNGILHAKLRKAKPREK